MNKSELIAAIAAKTGETKKDAEATLNAFIDVVTDALVKGDKVQLVGFGSFEVRKRAARKGRNPQTKEEIKTYIQENYYPLDFTLAEIRPTYEFDVSCQGSVPQALECSFESTDFEDAIRNCISIGGDSDTIAAICGGVAEAYYGIPEDIQNTALSYLDDNLLDMVTEFEQLVSEQGEV